MLEAKELGLGTVWVCYFQPDVIRKEFDLPDNVEPINILVIGYGNEAPSDTERHEHMRICLLYTSIPLSKREFEIVELLSLNAGQVFDRERIYERV